MSGTPRLAVLKMTCCDGCQLSVLNLEEILLELGQVYDIAYFHEAGPLHAGPFDLMLVDGSVSTPAQAERIRWAREQSRVLIPIGACACVGGVQALRNYADAGEYLRYVYPDPTTITALPTSTPVRDHVPVDFELTGCPVDRHQLAEVLTAFLAGRQPYVPPHTVCIECKRRGNVCVVVARSIPCLGPVTRAGCGALCPAYDRGCYGCFGPEPEANVRSLGEIFLRMGLRPDQVVRRFRMVQPYAPDYRWAGEHFAEEEE